MALVVHQTGEVKFFRVEQFLFGNRIDDREMQVDDQEFGRNIQRIPCVSQPEVQVLFHTIQATVFHGRIGGQVVAVYAESNSGAHLQAGNGEDARPRPQMFGRENNYVRPDVLSYGA